MDKLTLKDLPAADLRGRRVLVRVDYNVPLAEGEAADDTRIRATIPTIQYLLEHGARVILASHLGRPKGQWKEEFSLRPAADRLAELIERPVHFVDDIVGDRARAAVDALDPGEVLVLENLRFLPAEEANEISFAEELAALADIYVNDAFGAAHRAHASTAGVAEAMRRKGRPAVAGFLMERELRFL